MKVQKTIEVWLVKKRLPRTIDVVQYDTGIQLVFTVQDFQLPGGTTGTLYVQKPSGKFVYQETGITVDGNTITIDLENQAITEHGSDVPYQVQLKHDSDMITTFAGVFRVEKSLANDGAVKSETVIAAFEEKTAEQLAEIEAYTQEQLALAKQQIDARGAAVLASIPKEYTELSALAERNEREKAPAIVCDKQGDVISVADASNDYIRGLKLFGKTTQNGTPAPDAPIPLESVGADGNVAVTVCGKNLLPNTAKSQTINNVEFTVNEDGTVMANGTAIGMADLYFYGAVTDSGNYLHIPKGSKMMRTDENNEFMWIAREKTYGALLGSYYINELLAERDCYFYGIFCRFETGKAVNNFKIHGMILSSGSTDATYEPGKEPQTLTAQTPNGLHGIPVSSGGNYTDENGQQWICDEIDFEKGVYVQRVGRKNLTTVEESGANGTGETKYIINFGYFADMRMGNWQGGWCSAFTRGTTKADGIIRFGEGGHRIYAYSNDDVFVDKATANAWLAEHPVTVQYILATEKPITLTAEEIAQYSALHTNYPNTTIYNDEGAGMAVKYVADTKMYIDNKFAELATAILNA